MQVYIPPVIAPPIGPDEPLTYHSSAQERTRLRLGEGYCNETWGLPPDCACVRCGIPSAPLTEQGVCPRCSPNARLRRLALVPVVRREET